jgi:hypothetical protein
MAEVPVPPEVNVIEDELSDAVGPAGVIVGDNATEPAKAEMLVRVKVALPVDPC